MGSFNRAELCQLVGLFILYKLGHKYGHENIGLYRDDGLACFHGVSGSTSDRIIKDFERIFKKEFVLHITSAINKKVVSFLDTTFNCDTGISKPYKKPNGHPVSTYITSTINKKVVSFLDTTFNFDTGISKPYKKPNGHLYISTLI